MWKKCIKFIDENLTETVSVLSLLVFYCFDELLIKLNFLDLDDSDFQTLSIGLLILILNYFSKRLRKIIYERTTKINVVFINDSDRHLTQDNDCYVNFNNSMKLGVIYLNLRVMGDPKLLKNADVNIHFPNNIKINKDRSHEDLYTISSNQNSMTLNVKNFFNKEKSKRIDENKTIKIRLYKEGKDENNTIEINVNNSNIYMNHNKLVL